MNPTSFFDYPYYPSHDINICFEDNSGQRSYEI